MDKSIMPECYADTLLIETLVPTKKGYNHKHSCFNVESAMKNSGRFAVGIIDNDKNQIKYLSSFDVIDAIDGSLILWKHNKIDQYIIQICPALEQWIMNICEVEGIEMARFGIKKELNDFKRYTKTMSSIKNNNLKQLFLEISSKKQNRSVRKLIGWIKLLLEKNYQVDINDLQNV